MSVPSDAELLRRAYEEVQRLRAELARVTPECVGCLHQGGPLEECPLHGREYAYWVDGCTELNEQVDRLRAELAEARAENLHGCPRPDVYEHAAVLARATRAEAKLARVRELCATWEPRDDYREAITYSAASWTVLRALDGAG